MVFLPMKHFSHNKIRWLNAMYYFGHKYVDLKFLYFSKTFNCWNTKWYFLEWVIYQVLVDWNRLILIGPYLDFDKTMSKVWSTHTPYKRKDKRRRRKEVLKTVWMFWYAYASLNPHFPNIEYILGLIIDFDE